MIQIEKLRSRDELRGLVSAAKQDGKRVVFTNGCFDILHPGHVVYLKKAAELGDVLILALNSDTSVKQLKGPTRPILNEHERAVTMSGLESITWLVLFNETRVTSLLECLKPDVWVKGGDYTLESLDAGEREMAQSLGIQVRFIPPVEGISTTSILERIERALKQDRGEA